MSKARNVADLGSNDVLETTATGIDVTGTATMDGLTVDKGSDGADIATFTGANTGRKLAIQSFQSGSSVGAGFELNATSLEGAIRIATAGNDRALFSPNGDISFYEDTGTTAKFFWDASAESLGIGTASPQQLAHLYESTAATGAFLQVQEIGGQNAYFGVNTAGGSIQVSGANPLQIATNGTERMRIDSSGNLLVGCTSAPSASVTGSGFINTGLDYELRLSTNITNGNNLIQFINPNGIVGSITTNGTSTQYATSSDYRLKEDWQPMLNASTRVEALKPVNFAWKSDGSRVDGFLAHELAEVIPEAVTGEKDAVDAEGKPVYQGIDQSKLVPLLTASLQEALATIKTLEARLDAAGL